MFYKFILSNKNQYSKDHNVNIDYSPVFNIQLQQKLNIFPIFNDDHQVTTPGFIIEYEKPAYESNLNYHQQLFNQKIEQIKIKNKQLLIPKPKHRVQICSVCKTKYTDYLTHTQSNSHQKLFLASPYMKKIEKIQSDLSQQLSNYNSQSTDTEDASLLEQGNRKKIKVEISQMISITE
ncbi:unnamed protein product [Paramecium octaurelia]|uniref:DBF4-type domain-containing protein n=1 Tax=Paramecium octaurelia TaxID=43137 RepID=A0A8S1Y4X0_PAROT|nr:unnamed protein product [Paramecium octaurelia]